MISFTECGERRREWQRIMAKNQIESCWCRNVPRAGYMCEDCHKAFMTDRPKPVNEAKS